MAARSTAWVCDRLTYGIVGSNPGRENGYIPVMISVEVAGAIYLQAHGFKNKQYVSNNPF